MSNPATRALRLITHNFGWKLLSLLIAAAIWVVVASEPELSTFAVARVELENLPGNLELASEPQTTVLLELRGPAGELNGMADVGRRPAVVLNMAGETPGEHTFPITTANVKLPRGVRMVRITPAEVRFDFDREMTRQVPVEPRFTGLKPGEQIAAVSVDPQEVSIVGPRKRILAVAHVLTDAIDAGTDTGFEKVQVNVYSSDQFVRFVSTSRVTVSFTVRK